MNNTEKKNMIEKIVNLLYSFCAVFKDSYNIAMLQRITKALQVTNNLGGTYAIPCGYAWDLWEKHLTGSGSRFRLSIMKPEYLIKTLLINHYADWADVTTKIPDSVKISGCTYLGIEFANPIGQLRACAIKDLLDAGEGGRKVSIVKSVTGHYEVQMNEALSAPTKFVTLILGPTPAGEIIYTLHPGKPLHPGDVNEKKFTSDAFETTLQEAYDVGFRTVKFI